MDTAEYSYRLHKGHPIVRLGGQPYLLATGMSRSVGDSPIYMGRRDIDPHPSHLGVTVAGLRQRLGIEVAGVIGTDLMAPFNVAVCPDDRLVRFSEGPLEGEETVPLEIVDGAPVVPVRIADRDRRLLFDTAAPLSLLRESEFRSREPLGKDRAYHPLVGAFTTDRYTMEFSIGGQNRLFQAGVMPDSLENQLRKDGIHGVLGVDLLEHFGLHLYLQERVMKLGRRGGAS